MLFTQFWGFLNVTLSGKKILILFVSIDIQNCLAGSFKVIHVSALFSTFNV